MSTDKKDTKFTVLEGGAENSGTSMSSGQEIPTPVSTPSELEVSNETVEISKAELDDLAGLLSTFKDYLISHEERLTHVEEFFTEWIKAVSAEPTVSENTADTTIITP